MTTQAALFTDTQKPQPFARPMPRSPFTSTVFEDAYYGPMPDPAADPELWKHRVRAKLRGLMRKHGIASDMSANVEIRAIFDEALKADKTFDERWLLRRTGRLLRERRTRLMAAQASRKANARNSWYHLPQFLTDRVKASDEVICAALGIESMDDLYLFAGNSDQARNAVTRYQKEHAEMTDNSVLATSAEPRTSDGQPALEAVDEGIALADYFDGKTAEQPNGKPSLGDASAEPPQYPDYCNDPEKAKYAIPNHIKKELALDEGVIGLHIRNIYSGPLPDYLTKYGPMKAYDAAQTYIGKIKAERASSALNEQSKGTTPETTNESASTPPDAKAGQLQPVPSNVIYAAPAFAHPEMVIVYPADFGSILYKGIKFSVTLRAGGTFDMAVKLMDEFVAHKELIAPSCLVQATAAPNVIPMAQPAAAALPMAAGQAAPIPAAPAGAAPDSKGRIPGTTGTDAITGVKKMVDNGKTIIELWAAGQWAEHRLLRDSDHAKVTALGVDVANMQIGTTYPVNWKADWVATAKMNQKGSAYYRDVTALRNA